MACLVHHQNAQCTLPGSYSSLIWAWFNLHSEAEKSWHWRDSRLPSDCCKSFSCHSCMYNLGFHQLYTQSGILHFAQLELNGAVNAPLSIFLGSTLKIMEVWQVGSTLFPHEILAWFLSNQSLYLLVDGPKHSCGVPESDPSCFHIFLFQKDGI